MSMPGIPYSTCSHSHFPVDVSPTQSHTALSAGPSHRACSRQSVKHPAALASPLVYFLYLSQLGDHEFEQVP